MFTSLILTGCFAKKEVTDNRVVPELSDQVQEGENTVADTQDTSENGASQEDVTVKEDMQISEENTGSTSSQSEQEIIAEYEADLEALFDDLLGSGK